jgi:hypothetical protein
VAETRPIVINGLAGLDQRWNASAPTAKVAQDLWYEPRGALQSSGGYKRIIRGPSDQQGGYVNPFEGVGPIESIHWFQQHNGAQRWLIYIASGNLYAFNPSTAARSGSPGDVAKDRADNTITRSVVDTPWQRTQSACVGDVIYLCNGIDRPVVFNGYFWDYAGWSGPAGAPSAVAMAHPIAMDSGGTTPPIAVANIGIGPVSTETDVVYKVARRYRVTFINDRGAESPLSASSDLIYFANVSTSPGAHFAKLALPIGPPECVARRIYCTQNVYDSANIKVFGRDTQFYFHSTIPDNATAILQDGLDDAYLGSQVDEAAFGAWPAQAKYIAVFKDRVYTAGAGSSSVYYSGKNNPEVFPVNNVLPVGGDKLGPVTGMYATQNALVVFKARKTYLIVDDGVGEPQAKPLDGQAGCSAPNTVKEVPGAGIMFLSNDGIGILQGTLQNTGTPTVILNAGVKLPNIFRSLNRSAIINACAEVYSRDKEYWLSIPVIGAPNNRVTLIYSYEIREWITRPNMPIASIVETSDDSGALLFGSWDDADHEGIFVYTRAADDKDGVAITPVWESNQVSVASSYRSFRPLHVMVEAVGHGDNPLTVNIKSDDSLVPWLSPAQSVQQQYPQEPLPVYGSATYDGTATWADWRPIVMRVDVSSTFHAPVAVCSVIFEPADGTRYMTLFSTDIEINPEQTSAKPLKPDGS